MRPFSFVFLRGVLTVIFGLLVPLSYAQKLLLIVADGFGGSFYYKYSHLDGLRTFENEGVWSDLLYPEFPSLSIPNRQTLVSGLHPRNHHFVGNVVFNSSSGELFSNFNRPKDFDQKWWRFEPIYQQAAREGASVALFFWPECDVKWSGTRPSLCFPPPSNGSSSLDANNVKNIIAATRTHDLVMVYHAAIKDEAMLMGPQIMTKLSESSVNKLDQVLTRLAAEIRERVDLNLLVVSTHGIVDVPKENVRFIDDYLNMNLVNTTIGAGAVKQIVAHPGKTHQIFNHLRTDAPIPNVKIYYTTPRMGDLPKWYGYARSDVIPELVLIAQPGHAILSKPTSPKQLPAASDEDWSRGMSGYNNEFPDMLGVFLALGPAFKKGMRKGPANLVDIYPLMCHILSLDCPRGDGNMTNIDDVLVVSALTSRAIPLEYYCGCEAKDVVRNPIAVEFVIRAYSCGGQGAK
uniref:glycerophosphocholine cholinephosphodiesterase n=1 Tax=Plectus sambesii TaxID=2011161 RepID=A0A914W5E1_9BILA